jgi:hypothetical protein
MAMLQDIEVEKFLKDSVDVEPTLLQEEFIRLPADVAYWNERYAGKLKAHLATKVEVDHLHARLYIEIRETMEAEGKKATESAVEAKIETSPVYHQMRLTLVGLEAEVAHLKGVLEAVRTKREMVISLGAQLRQELQHDPVIRDQLRAKRLEQEG